jgi:beta-1,4-mannosyl-glycoprotein beta-1,4-N-acetylglucosaminyltransferase
MLEYRLNVLNDTVEYFVLVESTKTFMGIDKPLYYSENKKRFSQFEYKIIHVVVHDFIVPKAGQQWDNEIYQRNCINVGIEYLLNLTNIDYILISDIDEIPDPASIIDTYSHELSPFGFFNLKQDFYYYNLNYLNNEEWLFPKLITYQEYLRRGSVPSKIRILHAPETVEKGGWHLSYFGNASYIKNKIINFSHQEFNTDEITDTSNIENKIKNGKDILNRHGTILKKVSIEDNNYLPPKYDKYLNNFISD